MQNIRKFLPEATIIVATWEGQPLDVLAGLDIDKILLTVKNKENYNEIDDLAFIIAND